MVGKKLRKALDLANKCGIPYVVIVGENELNSGKLAIKEIKTGKEYSAGIKRVLKNLKIKCQKYIYCIKN